jgi:hypothetical protein
MAPHGFVPASDPLPVVGPSVKEYVLEIMKELGIAVPENTTSIEDLIKHIHATVSGTEQTGAGAGTDPGTGGHEGHPAVGEAAHQQATGRGRRGR